MGKWYLHASLFIFDRIIIKVAGNHDRHKSGGHRFDDVLDADLLGNARALFQDNVNECGTMSSARGMIF